MICLACHEPAGVIDSREGPGYTRRRRKCKGCGKRFTTIELALDEEAGGVFIPFFRVVNGRMVPMGGDDVL